MFALYTRPFRPPSRTIRSLTSHSVSLYHQSSVSQARPPSRPRPAPSRILQPVESPSRHPANPAPILQPEESEQSLHERSRHQYEEARHEALVHKSGWVVGSLILICVGIFSWKSSQEVSRKRPEATRTIFSGFFENNKAKTPLEKYGENFVCSRKNYYDGRWWVLGTSTFAHANLMHLGVNMYALWGLGRSVIVSTRSVPVLAGLWLVCGVGASCPDVFWPRIKQYVPTDWRQTIAEKAQWNQDKKSLGASGAIFGLLGFMGAHRPRYYRNSLLLGLALEGFFLASGYLPIFNHTAHISGAGLGWLSYFGWKVISRGRV